MTIINQKSISGITSITFASAGDDLLTFHSNNGTERFRIDNSGNTKITAGIVTTLTVTGNGTVGGTLGVTGDVDVADKIVHTGDTNTAIRFPAADTITAETAGSERLRIDSSGILLKSGQAALNSTSLSHPIQVASASDANTIAIIGRASDDIGELSFYEADKTTKLGELQYRQDHLNFRHRVGDIRFATGGTTERLRITSDGQIRIGSFGAPSNKNTVTPLSHVDGSGVSGGFQVNRHTSVGGGGSQLMLTATRGSSITSHTVLQSGDGIGTVEFAGSDGDEFVSAASIQAQVDTTPGGDDMPGRLIFKTTADGGSSPTERLRITSEGKIQVTGTRGGSLQPSDNDSLELYTSASNGAANTGSGLTFYNNDGNGSEIGGTIQVAKENGSINNTAGYMRFCTRPNASDVAERMRIGSGGDVLISRTSASISNVGHYFLAVGAFNHTRSGDTVGVINRLANDGTLIGFRQADNLEGSISVSGSTVSYNGGHLARWSQLASGAARTEILRGSVLSNLDEMCEWGEEDNEQLNRMKISDVEGDRNVSGVFQDWDDDDDTYTNDFYCAMTGDFVIRIAQGTTVARGDLLMSAGDGTAKPQSDDIVRSKTIAKVTSTTVSTTYSDGSYCVPCVLMAC